MNKKFPKHNSIVKALLLLVLGLMPYVGAEAADDITVQGVLTTSTGEIYNYEAPTPSGIKVRLIQINESTGNAGTAYDTVNDYGPFSIRNGGFSVSIAPALAADAMAADPRGWYIELSGVFIATQLAPATYRIPLNQVPLAATAVKASQLADDSLTSAMVKDNAVTAAKIASGAVDSSKIANGSIGDSHISTSDKININKLAASGASADQVLKFNGTSGQWEPATNASGGAGTVSSITAGAGLSGGVITTSGTIALDDAGVTTAKVADQAVSTAKIADAAVTDAKISDVAANKLTGTIPAASLPIATNGTRGAMRATTGKLTLDASGNITNIVADSAAVASSAVDFSGALLGDVTGFQSATVVSKLQGRAISATVPADGETLKWNAVASEWAPSLTGASGAAGGDLSGSYPNPLVSAVGGTSSADIASSVGATQSASSVGTAGTLVLRDLSGDFSAHLITSNLIGQVTGAATGNVLKSGDFLTGALTINSSTAEALTLGSAKEFRFNSADNTAYIALRAPAAVGSSISFTLPATDGSANQVLTTNGAGVLNWSSTLSSIGDDAVTTAKIADGAVTTAKMLDANITTAKIADGAVSNAKISDVAGSKITGTIAATVLPVASNTSSGVLRATTGKISLDASGNITNIAADTAAVATNVGAGAISTASIADGAVTTAKVADENITSAKIAADAVTTVKLADSNITSVKIADGAVTAVKIADSNISNAKLGTVSTATFKGRATVGVGNVEDLSAVQATALLSTLTGDTGSGGVKGLVPAPASGDASKYLKGDGTWGAVVTTPSDGSITTAKIGDAAVTTPKIADGAVTTVKIANGAVTTVKVLDANITTAKIADSNVTTAKIADGAVSNAKISDVAGSKITGTIAATVLPVASNTSSGVLRATTGKISLDASGNITNIAADTAAVATNVGAGAISTASIADGAVTAVKIADSNISNAKLGTVSTATFKGRATAGVGNVEDLSAVQATALLSTLTGDTGSGGVKGLVPAPASGDASKYLKGDGTWGAVATTPTDGSITTAKMADGAVTTAKVADANITTAKIADSSVTSAKIVDGAIVNGDINVSAAIARSKIASGSSDQVLINDGSGNFSSEAQLAVTRGGTGVGTLASNAVLLGNGSSAIAATSAGSANQILRVPAGGGAPAFGAIDISSSSVVANQLSLANGGTAKNMTAAAGGVVYTDADSMEVSAAGTAGQVLHSNGTGAPTWSASTGYTLVAYGDKVNPSDSTNYYFGAIYGLSVSTTADIRRLYVPKSGTIKVANVLFYNASTLSTSQAGSISIRLNNTTDTLISSSVLNNSTSTAVSNTGLSIPVSVGDYIEIKWTTPAWTTNPTNVYPYAIIYIE